jgi:hypothetical protein
MSTKILKQHTQLSLSIEQNQHLLPKLNTSIRLIDENLGGKQWHIDGLGRRKHSEIIFLSSVITFML